MSLNVSRAESLAVSLTVPRPESLAVSLTVPRPESLAVSLTVAVSSLSCAVGCRYDTNRDGAIELSELQRACEDFFGTESPQSPQAFSSSGAEDDQQFARSASDDEDDEVALQVTHAAQKCGA